MTPSPTSIAQPADLEADTRPGAVPGPGFLGTSPDLQPFCQPRTSGDPAPVAATPGMPAAPAEQEPALPVPVHLVSGTTEASFVFVSPDEPGAMPSMVASPFATPLASFQSVATGPASAAPPGGGDAPEGAATGAGAGTSVGLGALAATRAAAVIAAASQLPGADGVILGGVVIISDFTSLVPTSTLVAIVFCIATVLTAFAAGWWFRGEQDATEKWATLRPDVSSAASASPATSAAFMLSIFITRSGKFWHKNDKCHFLELSSSILERGACPACVKKEPRHRSPQVAATPRGSG